MPRHFCLKALQTPTTDRSEINLTFSVRHSTSAKLSMARYAWGLAHGRAGSRRKPLKRVPGVLFRRAGPTYRAGRLLSRVFDTRVHTVKVLVLRRKPRRGWAETWPEWSLA